VENQQSVAEYKSAKRLAFEHYLRTGRRVSAAWLEEVERKFNPYHDPRDGRFTFAPGGPRSLSHVIVSDRRVRSANRTHPPVTPVSSRLGGAQNDSTGEPGDMRPAQMIDAVYRPEGQSLSSENIQYRANPRARLGGNGGPRLNDPMTLERVFPGISAMPGGSVIAMANNILDLTGPANRLMMELTRAHSNVLIEQIQVLDPTYRFDSLGFPLTLEGQMNQIRDLRLDRTAAFYRVRGEVRPLQVETLRLLQERADKAYDEGVALYEAGRLTVRLSREEAIGNYVDRTTRRELRNLYNRLRVPISATGPVRIIGREYDTSGTDRTYRIPDALVGKIAYDVSLTRKMPSTPQIRGFFESDLRPTAVIIVRPSQLGPNSTYVITRPRN
jgi:hypothetical protein